MRERDHTVSATHGDMDQNTRDVIMREFRCALGGLLDSCCSAPCCRAALTGQIQQRWQ
jgi:hypothetical protein